MTCPRCGHDLIWGGDHDMRDLGYDTDGIESNYSCPCGVSLIISVPSEWEEQDA